MYVSGKHTRVTEHEHKRKKHQHKYHHHHHHTLPTSNNSKEQSSSNSNNSGFTTTAQDHFFLSSSCQRSSSAGHAFLSLPIPARSPQLHPLGIIGHDLAVGGLIERRTELRGVHPKRAEFRAALGQRPQGVNLQPRRRKRGILHCWATVKQQESWCGEIQ